MNEGYKNVLFDVLNFAALFSDAFAFSISRDLENETVFT